VTGTHLADAVAAAETDERRRALRALLARPLLSAHGPEAAAFALVRKHAAWLRDVLARDTGWQLQVDAEFARLRKTPADLGDATRGAVARPSRAPFTRKRYVLLCLALAALERADQQVTLGFLAERVIAGASDPDLQRAGIRFDLDSRDERSDLVAVVRLLLDLRLLERVAGDEQAFVNRSGDALYDVDRRLLAAIVATRRGPSTVTATDFEERLRAITDELVADTDEARLRRSRHRLGRRLLDDPVVYDDDLDDEERAYLARQRTPLTRRLAEATGFVPELRAEGTALLDPTGEATDLRMPEEGTDGHATLLLAEHLAAHGGPVPLRDLQAHLRAKAAEHRAYWRKTACEPGGPEALCLAAVRRLEALGLVAVDGEVVTPRPALARYRAGAVTVTAPRAAAVQPPKQETLL
jgi:uncharacterized protein (TIGR02678 family)